AQQSSRPMASPVRQPGRDPVLIREELADQLAHLIQEVYHSVPIDHDDEITPDGPGEALRIIRQPWWQPVGPGRFTIRNELGVSQRALDKGIPFAAFVAQQQLTLVPANQMIVDVGLPEQPARTEDD